jgi:hypothetical protein
VSSANGQSEDRRRRSASVDEVVDTVVAYVKNETVGPLRGAGRWLAWGTVGALLIGVGLSLALLGLLRLVQTEWGSVADGRLSWVPYLIVVVVGVVVIVLTLRRIDRATLMDDDRREGDR